MPKILAGDVKFARRRSKYDFALTGQLVEIGRDDVPWLKEYRRVRKAIRDRARSRGLTVRAQWLEDGVLAVRAERKKTEAIG